MRKFISVSIMVLGLVACGSHEPFDIGGDPSTGDAVSGDSSGRGEDAAPAKSGKACLNRCGDYDKAASCQCDTKCVDNGDCCGDYVKQCLTESPKPTVDAGSSNPADVAQPNCVDNDGDGYCDSAPKQGDCNDKDKNINPGAAELCASDSTGNGVDENCNGIKDEGCKATSNPAPTSNTLTVKYSDSASRRLSYGVTSDVSSIPYVWTTGSWQTSDTFTADLGNLQVPSSKCLYVRFNVDEPNSKWLCMANQLNAAATMTLNAFGKTYGTSAVQKISLGGGCSAIYAVSFDGASCPIP